MTQDIPVHIYRVWHGRRDAGTNYDVLRTGFASVEDARRWAVEEQGWTDSLGMPLNIEKVSA